MSHPNPSEIARQWWSAINRHDFSHAASLFAPDAAVDWPLTSERLPSPEAWRRVNELDPGTWSATVTDLVCSGDAVITTTSLADGGITVIAISRFTIRHGAIINLVEYWPETYAAPTWRAHLVQPINGSAPLTSTTLAR